MRVQGWGKWEHDLNIPEPRILQIFQAHKPRNVQYVQILLKIHSWQILVLHLPHVLSTNLAAEQNQDVKAENVVLHGERAVLIDFGFASWHGMKRPFMAHVFLEGSRWWEPNADLFVELSFLMLLKQNMRNSNLADQLSKDPSLKFLPVGSSDCLWGLQYGWWSGDEETGWITRLHCAGDYYAQALQRKSRLLKWDPCAQKKITLQIWSRFE